MTRKYPFVADAVVGVESTSCAYDKQRIKRICGFRVKIRKDKRL